MSKKRFKHSEHIKWCCEDMKRNMYDNRFPLDLSLSTRTYMLPMVWPHGGTEMRINYCPWCATHLKTLEDKFDEVLEKEYGIDNWLKAELPEEFKSEEWWLKRGL